MPLLPHRSRPSASSVIVRVHRPSCHSSAALCSCAAAFFLKRDSLASQGVNFWTDYLKAELSSRSVYTVPGIWQGSSSFLGFGEGASVMADSSVKDDVMDRLRHFVEECDRFQGACVPGA